METQTSSAEDPRIEATPGGVTVEDSWVTGSAPPADPDYEGFVETPGVMLEGAEGEGDEDVSAPSQCFDECVEDCDGDEDVTCLDGCDDLCG